MSEQQCNLDQYDIIIRHQNGSVVAAIPQFGLFSRAETIQLALDGLNAKKEALEADLASFADTKFDKARPGSRAIQWAEIKQFAIKAGIAFGFFLALAMYFSIQAQQIVDSAVYKLQANIDGFVSRGGSSFWSRMERELERLADPRNDLPQEKKQRLLANIRKVAERWRPFVSEALVVFSGPNEPRMKEPSSNPP